MPGNSADHAGLGILPFSSCLRLLAAVPVGRVSFFADRGIVTLAVNVVMDGQDPVFRTARGSKLSARSGLRPWVAGAERPYWIRIRLVSVSGRQIPGYAQR